MDGADPTGAPDAGATPTPRDLADTKIEGFSVSPSAAAGRTEAEVSWQTRDAARIEIWFRHRGEGRDRPWWHRTLAYFPMLPVRIYRYLTRRTSRTPRSTRPDGWIPWLCPLTQHGTRTFPAARSTEFRMIAGPRKGPWIEAHASVLLVPAVRYVLVVVFGVSAIAALWAASAGFFSDVTLVQSTPGWRTLSAGSRIASFVTTLIGVPVIGSLLRVWPGSKSNFGIRILQSRIVSALWLVLCGIAIAFVVDLRRSTEVVILSSQVDRTVHFLDANGASIALAVPPGVSSAIVSTGEGQVVRRLFRGPSQQGLLDGANDTIPGHLYSEEQGDVWILGCWSEVQVEHPVGFDATIELEEGKTVPVDRSIRIRWPSSVVRRARIPVPDCRDFPTSATLVVRDSVGAEALTLPLSLSIPPKRPDWGAAPSGLQPPQADVTIGSYAIEVTQGRDAFGAQLIGRDGWRATHCVQMAELEPQAQLRLHRSIPAGLEPWRQYWPPPTEADLLETDIEGRSLCRDDSEVERFVFVVPERVAERRVEQALACAYPSAAVEDTTLRSMPCESMEGLPWRLTLPADLSHGGIALRSREICNPAWTAGPRLALLPGAPDPNAAHEPETGARWEGTLGTGWQSIVWPEVTRIDETDGSYRVTSSRLTTAQSLAGPSALVLGSPTRPPWTELTGAIVLDDESGAASPWLPLDWYRESDDIVREGQLAREGLRLDDPGNADSFDPLWERKRGAAVGPIRDPRLNWERRHHLASCEHTRDASLEPPGSGSKSTRVRAADIPRSVGRARIPVSARQAVKIGGKRADLSCKLVFDKGTLKCRRKP